MEAGVRNGLVWAIAALFIIGTSAATAVPIAEYPLFGGQAVRFAIVGVILLAVAGSRPGPRPRVGRRDAALLTALAATGLGGFNVCLIAAVRYADPAVVGTVIAATPIGLALVGPLLDKRAPRRAIVLGCVVVALGAGISTGLGDATLAGTLLAVAALGCEIAFSLLAVPLLPRLGALRVTAYASALAAPLLLLTGLLVDGSDVLRMPTVGEALSLAYLTVVVAVLANLLWYAALPRIRADCAGLFYGFVPIGALTAAGVLGTGTPDPTDLLGAALVIAGLLIGLAPERWRPPARAQASDRVEQTCGR
jgi:drug/metabolite transporter (DMT)-like permease